MWPKFTDNCLTVEGKPWKNLNQEVDPTGDWTRAHCVRSNDVTPRPQGWSWLKVKAASWRKRLDTSFLQLWSRVCVSVTPYGFRGLRWFFSGFLPFCSTISPHSSHPFCFISSAPVMVRQAWSASTLYYSLTFYIGASSYLIPCVGHVLNMLFIYLFMGTESDDQQFADGSTN